jgi:FAD/FMN-containing dehydrogenase
MTFSKKIAGWGNFPWVNTNIIQISNNADIAETFSQSATENKKLIARGLGRSYADQAISKDGYTLFCKNLNKMLHFDPQSGVLECEAGVSLEEIIGVFCPQGWFPMICPGTKFVSIGGAIANDIHGKAHHVDGSFVNCVESFKIMLASGEIEEASRTENSDLFWANFGGLGLLGIIISAKIKLRRIETSFFKQKSLVLKNMDAMIDAIDESDHHYNYSVAWINSMAKGSRLGEGVLTLGNAASISDLPTKMREKPLQLGKSSNLKLPIYMPSFTLNKWTVAILNQVIHYTQSHAGEIVHYEKFFFPLDAIHDWNKGYGKRGFIQYQFVIPTINARENIKKILQTIAQSDCVPFLNVLKKFGPQVGTVSFPFEGYTFAIDFPVTKNLSKLTGTLDRMVLEYGGRIYLGKDAMLQKSDFEKMYPVFEEWKKIKSKYDPQLKFHSHIGKRLGLA